MNLSDPIADMFTRIRNAQIVKKNIVWIPYSKIKKNILIIFKKEGYIYNFKHIKNILEVKLKYYFNKPVIKKIKRISKPGLRIYKKKNNIPYIINGLGTVILSTSKGLLTDKQARKNNIGGELICYIY
ncbi:putative 30S ribosomal subunit protein S8 [Candidatus Zinderia insecticola CARI]|uniref:Small ribosomal subunit protein uS8 n=1 Tax=Zinderia insecticola (strain CARI) TaxID=871271 RepID=E0TJ34_ZINIC|nr:putative 30S ribosomal subunit protein S8 [Candidatus Zinderia insecticola CARI]